jgi:hypothetical protein
LPPNDIPANTIVAGSVAENNLPEVHQYLSLGNEVVGPMDFSGVRLCIALSGSVFLNGLFSGFTVDSIKVPLSEGRKKHDWRYSWSSPLGRVDSD